MTLGRISSVVMLGSLVLSLVQRRTHGFASLKTSAPSSDTRPWWFSYVMVYCLWHV